MALFVTKMTIVPQISVFSNLFLIKVSYYTI